MTLSTALAETERYRCKYLTICTGLHVIPQVPELPGVEHVEADQKKTVIHSSEYKERSQLAGRKVLILGSGETGNDIAYESVKAGAKEVVMCSRGGSVHSCFSIGRASRSCGVQADRAPSNSFLSFPKVLNNFSILGSTFDGDLPIDGLITNLFESAYVHPWVARIHLRWFVSDFVIKRVLWALTGTSAG